MSAVPITPIVMLKFTTSFRLELIYRMPFRGPIGHHDDLQTGVNFYVVEHSPVEFSAHTSPTSPHKVIILAFLDSFVRSRWEL